MADDDKVFLITGASSGIGAATARHAAAGRLPPRARRPLGGQAARRWPTSSAATSARWRCACDVTDWDEQEAMVAARPRALRPPRRRLRQRRLRRRARLPGGRRPSTGARWSSPTCSAPPTPSARRSRRSRSRPATSCSRARWPAGARSRAASTPRPSGRSPAWASRCARTSTAPASASRVIEPGHGRHAVLRQPRRGTPAGRRHRPRGHVRDRAAAARRRQRDPHTARRRSRGSLDAWDVSSDQSTVAASPTRRRRCGARARPSPASAPARRGGRRRGARAPDDREDELEDVEEAMREHDEHARGERRR